jgi:ATP-dependent Lhr-like helicase
VATFSDDAGDVASAAAAIRRLGETRIPRMTVATIDGVSASDTPLGRALQQGGFARSYKGLALR